MSVRVESRSGGYSVALPVLERRMLGTVWRLTAPGPNGTAEDVEALCVGAMVEVIRRAGFKEGVIDRDDALRHLLGEVIVLHRAYDPGKRHGSGSFSGYLYDRLRFRMLDYCRRALRNSAAVANGDAEATDNVGQHGGLGVHGSLAETASDRSDPRGNAVRGVLESGDRTVLREVSALGLCAPPGARGRTTAAHRQLTKLERARLRRIAEQNVEALMERVTELSA